MFLLHLGNREKIGVQGIFDFKFQISKFQIWALGKTEI
jgi:hypothetical protein